MQRKLLLLILVLLLISVGMVVAQSSTNFILQRSVLLSGGLVDSANYKVNSVIGQPATGVVDSSNYQVTAGYLSPESGYKVWLPVILN
jgi:hypothetical protein